MGGSNRGREDLETQRHAPVSEAQPTQAFELVTTEGTDLGKALLVAPNGARVYVGTSEKSDLRLSDPSVSRRHAGFEPTPHGVRVTDMGSTNGTFVDGVRVIEALLSGGEIVRVGATAFRVAAVTTMEPSEVSSASSFGGLIGGSLEMRRLYPLCARLAESDVPVVIEGETGTGKEVLAESIHAASARAGGPFVVFDCTAVAASLLESELFGHEKGAFTGAVSRRKGLFEQADGGTLLIDEMGDLDLALQPKLLRVLQHGETRRVGGDRWIRSNVRVLAATRRDLEREVQDGRFRDDLFYRLAVARIELPPLRARRGDVSLLTKHFWRELGRSDAPPYELLRRFERSQWPGNVRELYNAVARYIALGEAGNRTPVEPSNDHHDVIEQAIARGLPFPAARDQVLQEFERRYLDGMLAAHGGNVTQAARAAGVSRRYFTLIASRHRGADGRDDSNDDLSGDPRV